MIDKPKHKNQWSVPVGKPAAPAKSAPAPQASGKSAPADAAPKPAPAPVAAEPITVAAAAPVAPPAPAPVKPAPVVEAAKPVAAPVIIAAAKTVVVASKPDSTAGVAAGWTKAWPGKSFELWSESADALMGFATALSKAKSPTEVVELQSQFANENLDRFMRLSSEFATLPKLFFFRA